jgi:hypothetical protein
MVFVDTCQNGMTRCEELIVFPTSEQISFMFGAPLAMCFCKYSRLIYLSDDSLSRFVWRTY